MVPTRTILKALRATGLTARSGCNPVSLPSLQCTQVEVLDAKVINVCVSSVLGGGCWNHPRRNEVCDELAGRVEAALQAAGVEFRRVRSQTQFASDQFFINGYKL